MIKILDKKGLTPLWKGIRKIEILKAAGHYWKFKNKLIFRDKKRIIDKKYYHSIKNTNKCKQYKKKLAFIQGRSGKRYNPILKLCRSCKIEFIDKSSTRNKSFCSKLCKQKYFYSLNQSNGMNKIYKRNRREKENNIIHSFSLNEWKEKLFNTDGFCPSCNNYFGINKLTLDHIVPISKAPKGFIYTINDIQPLCFKCNRTKSNTEVLT